LVIGSGDVFLAGLSSTSSCTSTHCTEHHSSSLLSSDTASEARSP
jgi:hypothetical protein